VHGSPHPPARPSLRPPTEPVLGPRILVLLGHPALHQSRVNRRLADAVRGLPGVTVHDLYDAYPDFDIDVEHEKKLLLAHDIIVWQHPFYWYSAPALLKEWQDHVLEWGWAYGPEGNALAGKRFLPVLTTGGPDHAYHPDGNNRFTIRQLLTPLEATVHLCKMVFVPPLVVHGTHRLTDDHIVAAGLRYRRVLEILRDTPISAERLREMAHVDEIIAGWEL
jgi:glutathione-regulated potassium-efflux system ancillary protein KefG